MKQEQNYKTVLLISNNQVDIRGIERQFLDTGSADYRSYRCTTVAASQEQLGKKGLVIDIIILDIRLEDVVDPSDCYRTVRDSAEDIPVIILTGNSEEEQARALPVLAEGAGGHIYKEQFSALPSLINSLLFPKRER